MSGPRQNRRFPLAKTQAHDGLAPGVVVLANIFDPNRRVPTMTGTGVVLYHQIKPLFISSLPRLNVSSQERTWRYILFLLAPRPF